MSTTQTTATRTAEYKGRTYRLEFLGATKFGPRAKLQFLDGSKTFWVDAGLVREGGSAGRSTGSSARVAGGACRCRCHREPNAGQPGSILYDGCDRCGCEAC